MAVDARHAREARVTTAVMVTTYLILSITHMLWKAARNVLTTDSVKRANLEEN